MSVDYRNAFEQSTGLVNELSRVACPAANSGPRVTRTWKVHGVQSPEAQSGFLPFFDLILQFFGWDTDLSGIQRLILDIDAVAPSVDRYALDLRVRA